MCARQPLKYLKRHHITHRKIFRATWSQNVRQKLMKPQNFRESHFALKNKILPFARFLRLSYTSSLRNVTIWCALDIPGLGKPVKYLERHHITHRKFFRATWSWKRPNLVFQSQLRVSKIMSFRQFLPNFSTSN